MRRGVEAMVLVTHVDEAEKSNERNIGNEDETWRQGTTCLLQYSMYRELRK